MRRIFIHIAPTTPIRSSWMPSITCWGARTSEKILSIDLMAQRRFPPLAAMVSTVAAAIRPIKNSDFISCLPQRRSCSACSRPWDLRRLISIILCTKPSNSAHVGHTLLKRCKSAIRSTAAAAILGAPRIVLGLGALCYSDDPHANSQHEQQDPHGRILVAPCYKCLSSCFIPSRAGGGAEPCFVCLEASFLVAVSVALNAETAEVAAGKAPHRHSHNCSHSPHRILRPASVVVRHVPCRRHRTSPN
jgi:hypothetical protein